MRNNFINLFIARRISASTKSRSELVMVRIAIISVAVSIATMIIAINIVTGFKNQISDKVVGFVSHYNITSLYSRNQQQISMDSPFVEKLTEIPYVQSISPYSQRGGVMKSESSIVGVMYKGVDSLYNLSFYKDNLKEGNIPNLSDSIKSKEVLISRVIANKMELSVGDKFEMMFLGDVTYRDRLTISGIYDSSFAEFDSKLIIGDIRNVNRLFGVDATDKVSGFELKIDKLSDVDKNLDHLEEVLFENSLDDEPVMIVPITEEYLRIFDWLKLQDTNIWIVIIVMIFVAAFNIIAMMLIILINKSYMIGILKAMGMKDSSIQAIFLARSSYIMLYGIAWGVAVGLSLSLIQQHYKIIKLSGDGYFLTHVPVEINYLYICAIVVISFVMLLLFEMIPVKIVSRMSPHKSIKFN